jgi:hypothetical protein
MIRKLEREHLSADLATVEAMLRATPEDDLFGRLSLEERCDELRRQLASWERDVAGVHTALLFGGAPVIGSRGIDAGFASEAVGKYQDLVSTVWALKEHGNLASSGPIPDRYASRLHITNIVHGSFGFELAEAEGSALLRETVEEVTAAILAAGQSDDALADAVEALDPRSFKALRAFFAVLRKARASFRVVTGEREARFDIGAVDLAAERTEARREDEEDVPVPGEFLAVLPEGRRFEFRAASGELLGGRVADDFTTSQLRKMNAKWANTSCVAHLHVVTLTRGGRARTRYVLTDVRAPEDLGG